MLPPSTLGSATPVPLVPLVSPVPPIPSELLTCCRVAKNSVQPPKVPPVQPPNPSPEVLLSAPLVKRKCWLLDLG